MANLSLNRQDSCIVNNRGFQVANTDTGLEANRKNNSSLHDSIDSKKMVKNLCSSQRYLQMTEFSTLICNQKKHYGIKNIKYWIDDIEWQKHFPYFHDLDLDSKDESCY